MRGSKKSGYYHYKQRFLQDVKIGYQLERKNHNRYNRRVRHHKTDCLGELKGLRYLDVETCW